MLLRSSLFFLALACYGQTAITELTSFWEMDVTDADRIAWDSKGTAHGTYFGTAFNAETTIFGSGWRRGAGAQTPTNSGGLSVPGAAIATGTSSFSYCTWVRPATNSDPLIGQWSSTAGTRSWSLTFQALPGKPLLTYQMTNGNAAGLVPGSGSISAGSLALVCMHYNSATGQLGISANGAAWTKVTPAAPFQPVPSGNACSTPSGLYDPWYPCTLDFAHQRNQYFPTGSPTIGRTMFWNGYVPTDAELSELYNSGSGRDAAYFGLSYTPPTRPLTVSLTSSSFADDANLTGQQGVYWLRPYPLKFWSSALAAANGDYLWLRSTDHNGTSSAQKVYIGYSASPETLPESWADLTASLPRNTTTYPGLETPMIVWNPDTSLFHLYAHGDKTGASVVFRQVSMVWTSPDLSTWTWVGEALPLNTAACPLYPCYNHTGYATFIRNGTGDWAAQSLLTSSEPSGTDGFIRMGIWASTDGLTWTLSRETEFMVPKMPYRNEQNQRIGDTTGLASPPSTIYLNRNYVGTPYSQFEWNNPAWPLFFHDGDGSYNGVQGQWLQDVRAYEESGTVWLYAKWSFREPSTIRLYKGTLNSQRRASALGSIRLSGGAKVQ